jgi:hypothetical protein
MYGYVIVKGILIGYFGNLVCGEGVQVELTLYSNAEVSN